MCGVRGRELGQAVRRYVCSYSYRSIGYICVYISFYISTYLSIYIYLFAAGGKDADVLFVLKGRGAAGARGRELGQAVRRELFGLTD